MFRSRYTHVGDAVDLDDIRYPLVRDMVGQYDTYKEDNGEYLFMDPYGKFFFTLSDTGVPFTVGIDDVDDAEEFLKLKVLEYNLPIIRMIYVVPHQRNRGIQKKIITEVQEIAEKVGNSFCIFADPFKLSGFGRETTALEGYHKMRENGFESADNYWQSLNKQRERFFSLGFYNCELHCARHTGPSQHFVYIHSRELDDNIEMLAKLQRFYTFDIEKAKEVDARDNTP